MMEKLERIDKILASQGKLSRKEARQKIKQGAVIVNGKKILSPEQKVNPKESQILIDQKTFNYQDFVYYMLHKPLGVISATRGREEEATVLDLVPPAYKRDGLFPAGRLDKNTEGFILLTDDGVFAHEILSPRKHVSKTYQAILQKPLSENDVRRFAEGLEIGGEQLKPAGLTFLDTVAEGTLVEIILYEGRYHQIRRMAHALQNEVLFLKRTHMGKLALDKTLKEGEMRPISEAERCLLKTSVEFPLKK